MKRKGVERVEHIKDYTQRIIDSTKGISLENFRENWILQAAVTRFIEIIGEASKYVPDEIKTAHPEIPWKEMAGMRDIAVHDYDDINVDEIWNIIQNDIPTLKKQIDAIEIE